MIPDALWGVNGTTTGFAAPGDGVQNPVIDVLRNSEAVVLKEELLRVLSCG